MTEQPLLIVVAGPNGSGKSTLTASGLAGDAPVIDPDAIARSLNPDNPAAAAVSAGKEALSQQQDAIENKQTFAVETTLSGNGPLRLMEQAQGKRCLDPTFLERV
jgi:predicted ABC-type ATPase